MKIPRPVLALLLSSAAAGCLLPTDLPVIEQRWILPVDSSTISVTEFLPSGVSVAGNTFRVDVDPFTTVAALTSLCPPCAAFQGVTAPAPPFEGSITVSQALPTRVTSAVISNGSMTVAVRNEFNFDPIVGGGSLTITLTDGQGGRQLGQAVHGGTFPPGSTVTLQLAIAPGIVRSMFATTVLRSPGGQVTTVDGSQRMVVTATPQPITVTSATVDAAGEAVSIGSVPLDVQDIDEQLSKRIEKGAIVLEVANPFGVAIDLQVDIAYPGGRVSKALAIGRGATSTATLQYTGDELRSFLGQPNVTFAGSGAVSASAGTITVTPGQTATIRAKLDLTLRIGD